MTADEPEFLRAIIASPDDDSPRLVYADWLDEHGRPDRAAFIRVQVELARLPDGDPRRAELRDRERELLAKADEWGLPLADKAFGPAGVRRGFVEKAAVGARQLLTSPGDFFDAAPLTRLKVLRINQTRDADRDLAKLPHLGRLRELDLEGSGIGPAKLGAILAGEHLGGLERLDLTNAALTPAAWATLGAAGPAGLRDLGLGHNNMGGPGLNAALTAAAAAPPFRLRALDFTNNNLRAGSALAFFSWPGLAGLGRLTLDMNTPGLDGVSYLAHAEALAGLTHLSLTHGDLKAEHVRRLAGSPHLRPVALDLSSNRPGRDGLRALLGSPVASRLEDLRLDNAGLPAAAAGELAAWPGLARLHTLHLGYNEKLDAARVLASPLAPRLRRLDVSYGQMTDGALAALAASPAAATLEWLDLSVNLLLSDAGLGRLLDGDAFPRLRAVRLESCRASPTMLKRLRERFGAGEAGG